MLVRLAVLVCVAMPGPWAVAQSAAAMAAKRAAEQQFGVERPLGAERRERPAPEKWQASGKIHSMNARQINVITESGEPWQVMLQETTAIKVAGEGGIELLKPRSAVRFEALVNARGVIDEPVTEVTIFQPRQGFQPMLEDIDEDETGDGARELDVAEPERPVRRAAARPTSRSNAAQRGAAEPRRVTVMGVLTNIRRGRFMIDAGEDGKVRGEIAEDAKVKADFSTHAAARIGDAINVEGITDRGPTDRPPFRAMAQKIEITLVPPAPEEEDDRRGAARSKDRENDDEPTPRSRPAAD